MDDWQRAPGSYAIGKDLVDSGVGLIQLPCPEFFLKGLDRRGMTFEEYNTPENRTTCQKLIEPILFQARHYKDHGYELVGVLGIHESPNCSISGQRGVFMDEFFNALKKEGIDLSTMEISSTYGLDPKEEEKAQKTLADFLRQN